MKYSLLSFLVVALSVLLLAGCGEPETDDVSLDNLSTNDTISNEKRTANLEYVAEVTTIATREPFKITLKGSVSEDALVIIYTYMEGNNPTARISARLGKNVRSNLGVNAFVDGRGNFDTLFFYDPGTFIYEAKLYFCSDLEASLGEDFCKEKYRSIHRERKLDEIEPYIVVRQEIIVTGDVVEFECSHDDDCEELCEGCKKETQSCIQRLCQDCFSNLGCIEGYMCEERSCIPR